MANPNKTYEIPCQIDTRFDDAGGNLLVRDFIKLGKRIFQMNGYLIEVE